MREHIDEYKVEIPKSELLNHISNTLKPLLNGTVLFESGKDDSLVLKDRNTTMLDFNNIDKGVFMFYGKHFLIKLQGNSSISRIVKQDDKLEVYIKSENSEIKKELSFSQLEELLLKGETNIQHYGLGYNISDIDKKYDSLKLGEHITSNQKVKIPGDNMLKTEDNKTVSDYITISVSGVEINVTIIDNVLYSWIGTSLKPESTGKIQLKLLGNEIRLAEDIKIEDNSALLKEIQMPTGYKKIFKETLIFLPNGEVLNSMIVVRNKDKNEQYYTIYDDKLYVCDLYRHEAIEVKGNIKDQLEKQGFHLSFSELHFVDDELIKKWENKIMETLHLKQK